MNAAFTSNHLLPLLIVLQLDLVNEHDNKASDRDEEEEEEEVEESRLCRSVVRAALAAS